MIDSVTLSKTVLVAYHPLIRLEVLQNAQRPVSRSKVLNCSFPFLVFTHRSQSQPGRALATAIS